MRTSVALTAAHTCWPTCNPRAVTVEGGEVTPTMKLKRKVGNDKYRKEIEELYTEV